MKTSLYLYLCLLTCLAATTQAQFSKRLQFPLDASVHPDFPQSIHSVSQVGDVNLDGTADFAVSLHITLTNNFERVVLVSGADGSFIRQFNSASGPGIRNFGSFMMGLPDLNGDGYDDLYVVASLQINGAIHVISGLDGSAVGSLSASSTIFNFTIGHQSVDLGDVSGDGGKWLAFSVPDEIGPNPANPSGFLLDVGAVYIIRAQPGIGLSTVQIIRGSSWGQRLGQGLSSVGDVNGDGVEDIAAASILPVLVNGIPFTFVIYDTATGLPIRGANLIATAKLDDVNGDGCDDYLGSTGLYSGLNGSLLYNFTAGTIRVTGDIDGDGIRDFMKNDAFFSGADGALLFGVNTNGSTIGANYAAGLRTSMTTNDFDGDGFNDASFLKPGILLVSPPTIHVVSDCGAKSYNDGAGGLQLLKLRWRAGGQVDPAIGDIEVSGASPGALGLMGVSLASGAFNVYGLNILVDNAPANVVANLGFGFDLSGRLLAPAFIRSPFVAGVSYYFQAFETFPRISSSNGLELRFVP